MATRVDPNIVAHLEWLGFVRPTGLVVSAPALVQRGVILDRRDIEGQRRLIAVTEERAFDARDLDRFSRYAPDFRAFAEGVLDWTFDRNYVEAADLARPCGPAAGPWRDAAPGLRGPRA